MGHVRRKQWNVSVQPIAVFLLLLFLGFIIYSNSFSAPFLFDDESNILENSGIRHLATALDFSGTRSVGYFTFALNYYFGGLNVFGYHLVNLLIHVANGFLVYLFVLLLFRAARKSDENPWASWTALFAALLFVAHPIQTQATTYIVQRFASLVTLFYLSSVVFYLKWRLDPSRGALRRLFYGMALLSVFLAMKTKENGFTIPLLLLFMERIFFGPLGKKQWISLIPFLLTLLIIPISLGVGERGPLALPRDTLDISRLEYLLTQFPVLITYLRLLFIPLGQNLDHDFPVYDSLGNASVLFSLTALSFLFGLAIYLLKRDQKLVSFGIFWFFLTISVESSIIPIKDLIFEHRVYLPSVGFCLVIGMLVLSALKKWMKTKGVIFVLGFLYVGGLGAATYQRNFVWQDEMTLWKDVVSKSPGKARGHNNLANLYKDKGRIDESIQEYRKALQLTKDEGKSDYAQIHYNLGVALTEEKRFPEAIQEYQTALRLKSDYPKAHNNMAVAYSEQGEYEKALQEFESALKLKPDYPEAYFNRGMLYRKMGDLKRSAGDFQKSAEMMPNNMGNQNALAELHNNLGHAHMEAGRYEEAIQDFQEALKTAPHLAKVHYNMGNAYAALRRLDEAEKMYQAALRLDPGDAEAYNNLGSVYMIAGRLEEAIQEYQMALRLNPNYADAQNNLRYAKKNRNAATKK